MTFHDNVGDANRVTRWVTLFLVACIWSPAMAQPRLDPAFLELRKKIIEKWLEEAGLAENLEVLKLRKSEHPDPRAGNREAYRLELRLKTGYDEEAAQSDFQKFLDAQVEPGGQQFQSQIFYKLVHLLGKSRESVSVHFYVLRTEYAVYFDSLARELVMDSAAKRSLRRVLSVKAPVNGSMTKSGALTVRRATANQKMPETIRKFLERYFGELKGVNGPAIQDWRPNEADYLEVTVSRMKGQVMSSPEYWEKLSLSIEVKPSENGWQLVCFFNGQYASGMGTRPPADGSYYLMEKDYRPQLDKYADKVLSSLQQHLEKDQ